MLDVYTLKSCDTCRKATKWLDAENIAANIIDIRATGISEKTIEAAVTHLGWEKVLNRRSTSWRSLDDNQKKDMDSVKVLALIVENSTLMKRPLFESAGTFFVGFDQSRQDWIKSLVS